MNVQSLDECPPRLFRLKMRLARYHCIIEYVQGKKLQVADALSRAPVDRPDLSLTELVESHIAAVSECWPASQAQLKKIREETLKDPQLKALLNVLRNDWPAGKKDVNPLIRSFWDNRQVFTEVDGLILKGTQIVIPQSMQMEMLRRAHEGHLGVSKMRARVRSAIWWPGKSQRIESHVAECETCARFRSQQRKEPLQSVELPQRPWEKVAADLFEWEGQAYLLLTDYYSRFPEVRHLPATKSEDVISAMQDVFSCHGFPSVIVSDNGPQFASRSFRISLRDLR
eukprot:m.267736 g.267736  ORF g.267736 m.267736 type:complete len:284 (+) comp40519_c0_seq8:2009-2860(+)